MRHHVAIIIAGVVDPSGRKMVFTTGDDALFHSQFLQYPKGYRIYPSGIHSLSAFSAAIDDGASIATSGVTTWSILADDPAYSVGERPIDIFARVGAESLSADQVWFTQQLSAGATEITLSGGTAQSIRRLHIGTETIRLSANVPASGTVAITQRGDAMTIPMPHRANLSGFLARTIPVTSVPVEWIGRRVYVYVDDSLWRIMILTDNPHVDAHLVSFSMIDEVNVLSVQKKSCQVPAFATTLSPQTISLKFDLVSSRPGVAITASEPTAMQTSPTDFANNGFFTGGTQRTRNRTLLWYDWASTSDYRYRYGWNGIPEMTLHLVARHDPLIDATIPMQGGAGIAQLNISYDCYLGPARPGADLDEFLSDDMIYTLRRTTLGPVTYWAGEGLGYIGDESSDWALIHIWNEAHLYSAPWSAKYQGGSGSGRVRLKSRFCPQVGWPNSGSIPSPFAVGLVFRRNINAADNVAELATANTLTESLYERWSLCNEINSSREGPIALFDGSSPDYAHCFYPVRPKKDGDVHNVVVTPRNVVFALDAWWWDRTLASGGFDVDYCLPGCWWEPGIYQIKTVAQIPMTGTSGPVEIRWQEPSGEWLRALATVTYQGVSSNIYTYSIDPDVEMLDGAPCVGFGTWAGFADCQITPPTFIGREYLGNILAKIIASSDSTSGRISDSLGDGFGVPISSSAMLSFSDLIAGGLGSIYRFAADDELSYNDFIELACRITGSSIVGRMTDPTDLTAGWSPFAVPMGRPVPEEKKATWTDADIIGIPTTSDGFAGVVYTSYSITAGKRHWQVDDWLAGDILGQGEELEIDLTPILPRPSRLTDSSIEQLVGCLRDRFGVIRRRWSMRVPIERTINLGVGDVVAVTSEYLVDPAGGLGVENRLARILSITHDFVGAVSDVEMIAYAEYGAGWNLAFDVVITSMASSPSYDLQLLGSSGPEINDVRRERDLSQYQPLVSSSTYYRLVQTEGVGAGGISYGYLTSWDSTNHTATFYQTSVTSSPALSTGCRGVLIVASTAPSTADLFILGRDRLL